MRCREFQDRISAAVDECLPAEEIQEFTRHADICRSCRREFQEEAATKRLLRARATMCPVPPALEMRIRTAVEHDPGVTHRLLPFFPSLLVRHPLTYAAVAAAAAVLAALLVRGDLREPTGGQASLDAAIGPDDMITLSVERLHSVLSGGMPPDVRSSEPSEIEAFFAGKTKFPVHVPPVPEWKLVGGSLSEHEGNVLVHVMYDDGGVSVCLSQSCWDSAEPDSVVQLSPVVVSALQQSGWFATQNTQGDAIVAWRQGGTLCIAVARMESGRLMRCLRDAQEVSVP